MRWFRRKRKEKLEVRAVLFGTPSSGTFGATWIGTSPEQIVQASAWVYAGIQANARALASLPVVVQERQQDRWVDVAGHPALGYLHNPNPGQTPAWSFRELIEAITAHLYLVGTAALLRMDDGLYLLSEPQNLELERDEAGWPRAYIYNQKRYKPSQVVLITWNHPFDPVVGSSPLAPLRPDLTVEKIARERLAYNLANRIGAPVIMTISGGLFDAVALGEDGTPEESGQLEKLRQYLEKTYQAASQDGKPLVVGEDLKVDPFPVAERYSKELYDARKASREAVLAILGTPPPLLGIYEQATLNNFRESQKIWWQNTLLPLYGSILDQLTAQVIWPRWGRNIRLAYDLSGSDIGLLLLQDRIEAAQKLVDLGYPTNMAAVKVGLDMPFVPELDTPNIKVTIAGRA